MQKKNKIKSLTLNDFLNSNSNYFESPDKILHLFWQYENYLRAKIQPIMPKLSYRKFYAQKMSIVHIASKLKEKSKVLINDDMLKDEDFLENYLNSLGNLTFISNVAESTNDYQSFHKDNFVIRSQFKIQNELEDFLIDSKWTKESIRNRQDKIIKFAQEYWNEDAINFKYY